LRGYVQPASGTLLFDTYTGATAGYSVRKLRTAYAGSCLRVQRSSDSTEQDIGFDGAGYLDTASMLTFCGANNGHVVTWYDQSGNGYNLTGGATVANIVNAGALRTANSVATLRFANFGKLYHLAGASFWTTATSCVSAVASLESVSENSGRILSVSVGTGADYVASTGVMLSRNGTGVSIQSYRDAYIGTRTINYNQLYVMQTNFTGSEGVVTLDGSAATATAITTSFNVTQINVGGNSAASAGELLTGHISEMTMWPTNQASNVAAMRTSQKNYFGTA